MTRKTKPRIKEYSVEPNIYRRDGSEGTTFRTRMRIGGGKKIGESFDTLEEAREWVRDAKAGHLDIDDTPAPPPAHSGTVLWKNWFEHWFSMQDHLAKATRTTYLSSARAHLIPWFGEMPVGDIRASDVIAFQQKMRSDKAAPASIDKCRQVLGATMSLAVLDGLAAVNPTRDLPKRRKAHSDTSEEAKSLYLTLEELDRLEECMDPWWRLAVRFQVETGLRIGELAGLRVFNVNTATGYVTITNSLQKHGELGPPKSEAGKRLVRTLMPETLARVIEQIESRGLEPTDFLFSGPRKGKLDQDTYRSRKFNPAMREAGLGHILDQSRSSTHVLRHTLATNLMAYTSMGSMDVAVALGHSDSIITERRYTHLQQTQPKDCRNELEQFYRRTDESKAG